MNRILLILEHKANRTLLSNYLKHRYEVIEAEQGIQPDIPCDLCLLDGPALDRYWQQVRQHKASESPMFWPVVLITSNHEVELLTRHLWKTVDELIKIPIEKVELLARVEMLLRTRELSRDLKWRSEDLESFFHAMAHEVRAPLRAIAGFTHLLQEEEGPTMKQQGQGDLTQIQAAVGQMQKTIDGLIAFARVERRNLQMQSVLLEHIIQAATQQMQAEIKKSEACIIVEENLPAVIGDPFLLTLAVVNLLSNALKFRQPDVRPLITICVTTFQQACRLEIKDNGVGIAIEDQRRLFQPFEQLHGIEVYDGMGLGLATVRRVVELMGGRCGLSSTEGQGSTFWLELRRGADK